MLCQNKAERLGIRTARLPIGTYLANLPTRKVLTVNQVSFVSYPHAATIRYDSKRRTSKH